MTDLYEILKKMWHDNHVPPSSIIISDDLEVASSMIVKFISYTLAQYTKVIPENNHDIVIIDGRFTDIGVNKASSITIDQIRYLNERMSYKGGISPYKFCVIIEAEQMNLNASNALLKTLEEPLENSFIFLVTKSITKIIPTILSRCVKIKANFNNLDTNIESDKRYKNLFGILMDRSISYKDKLEKIELFSNTKDLNLREKISILHESIVEDIAKKQNNTKLASSISTRVSEIARHNLDLRQVLITIFANFSS